jgi:hypothetical protein
MPPKIGGENSSGKVTPQSFEPLAEEAGLAKPMVKRRVPEPAETILAMLPGWSLLIPLPMPSPN